MKNPTYSYIKKSIRENLKEKLVDWRKSRAVEKIDKPTDIGRARNLGYKDKKGFVVVRVRIIRGGRKRPRPKKGRRSKRMTVRKTLKMNYRWVAEQRASKKFSNLEVLNSYNIAKDGINYFFEVIMIDKNRPEIKNDKVMNWICSGKNNKRVFRGLTSAGKKSRGLRNKSRELKIRPGIRARGRKGK
ncbi:MAG: 50S ribosomal protein L15e [Nanoarchaeota archaeon]|nr:50S ribosomal protein L15e [Nanoarchaeota archaeon]